MKMIDIYFCTGCFNFITKKESFDECENSCGIGHLRTVRQVPYTLLGTDEKKDFIKALLTFNYTRKLTSDLIVELSFMHPISDSTKFSIIELEALYLFIRRLPESQVKKDILTVAYNTIKERLDNTNVAYGTTGEQLWRLTIVQHLFGEQHKNVYGNKFLNYKSLAQQGVVVE